MDPNETLRQIRLLAAQIAVDDDVKTRDQHAADLLELTIALDEWLSRGGFLPTAWEREHEAALLCGRCHRNLRTDWGQLLHGIFSDGSMRCYAPEGKSGRHLGTVGVELDYTATFVALRPSREQIAQVANWDAVTEAYHTPRGDLRG